MKIKVPGDYRQARRAAYPDLAEQLDAVWKTLGALQASGVELAPATQEMLDGIRGVKARFPKPERT